MVSLVSMYDYENLDVDYDISKQKALESWLNVSFRYLSSLDWRGFNKRNCADSRDIGETYRYLSYLIDFFRDFFVKNSIDIVTISLECFLWNLVAYYVARRLGIPVINMVSSRFPKRGLMFGTEDSTAFWCWNEDAKEVHWDEIYSFYAGRTEVRYENAGLASYWHPKSMFDNLNKARKYLATRGFMARTYKYEKVALLPVTTEVTRAIWATIRGIINRAFFQQPVCDEQFFFLPLHYEDDANITMMEPFTNQFELVGSISRCLPQGVKLYVKPHPGYMGTDIRFRDFLRISKLKNVRILHPLVSPISLIKDSIGVITLNNTTGFEAMIFDKPVISLGHDFYCRPDLCYMVKAWDELPDIIFKVFRERTPRSSPGHFRNFAKLVYRNTVFTKGDIYFADDPLTDEDGTNVAYALDKIFRKIEMQNK